MFTTGLQTIHGRRLESLLTYNSHKPKQGENQSISTDDRAVKFLGHSDTKCVYCIEFKETIGG